MRSATAAIAATTAMTIPMGATGAPASNAALLVSPTSLEIMAPVVVLGGEDLILGTANTMHGRAARSELRVTWSRDRTEILIVIGAIGNRNGVPEIGLRPRIDKAVRETRNMRDRPRDRCAIGQ